MPRFDAQNFAIAVVIFTFGGVAWVCGTAHLTDGKINLPDKTIGAMPDVESVAEPVVVEAHEFSSVVKLASEDAVTSVAVQSAENTNRKRLPGPQPSKTGTIRGRIVFDGTPPEHDQYFEGLPPIDAAVCGQTEQYDESLLVNPLNNGIKNVFVYLIRSSKGRPKTLAPVDAVRMTFRGCRLEPRCVIVQTKQRFEFQFDDPIAHNPDLNSARNMLYSIPLVPTGGVWDFEFKHPEAVRFSMTCAIHPWIRGLILVSDHPFAAVTDQDGEFVIPNVPYGKHKFRIFHERGGQLERGFAFTVDSKEIKFPELSYDVSKFGY